MASKILQRKADKFYDDPDVRDAVLDEIDSLGTGAHVESGLLALPSEGDFKAWQQFSEPQKELIRAQSREHFRKAGLIAETAKKQSK